MLNADLASLYGVETKVFNQAVRNIERFLFWGWIWGVMGMILAVLIMMALGSIADHVDVLWPIAELLGEGTNATSPQRNI